MGYTKRIAEEFQKQDLPSQFFYLAMVESSFNEVASARRRGGGYARHVAVHSDTAKTTASRSGRWWPTTARPGRRPHKWEKATRAAGRTSGHLLDRRARRRACW